jgi:hypothetical protein
MNEYAIKKPVFSKTGFALRGFTIKLERKHSNFPSNNYTTGVLKSCDIFTRLMGLNLTCALFGKKPELKLPKGMNSLTLKNKITELSRLLIQALEMNNIANIIGYQRQLKEALISYEQKQMLLQEKVSRF